MEIILPPPVAGLLCRLEQAGFAAYAVGGGLRDSLLGKAPADWDLASGALPEQVRDALAGLEIQDTGVDYGTVTVFCQGERVEITTFRAESGYSDHRRPDRVRFSGDIREDLARRDFTVNAMAFSPNRGLEDPFGGLEDLKNRVLRTVGDPKRRLEEDPLRILRGLRFAAQLGFSVHPDTARAMEEKRGLLAGLSPQRAGAELLPLLCGESAPAVLREYREIFAVLLPQLRPMFDFDQQNPHHIYDVWEHTLHALEAVPPRPELRLAMLLHDCGKPKRFSVDFRGDGHFYGHAAESARRSRLALQRLGLEEKTARRVLTLIAYHDYDLLNSEKSLLRWLRLLGPQALEQLILVKRADNLAQSPYYDRQEALDKTARALEALLERGPCYDRRGLAVSGGELKALGLEGPAVGRALEALTDQVMEGRLANQKAALLEAAGALARQEKLPQNGA